MFRHLILPLVLSLPKTCHGITCEQMGASYTKEGITFCSCPLMPPEPAGNQPENHYPLQRIPPRATAEPPLHSTPMFSCSQHPVYDPGSQRPPLDPQDWVPAPEDLLHKRGELSSSYPEPPEYIVHFPDWARNETKRGYFPSTT